MSANGFASTSMFFSQLRSFSVALETHARSLRQAADGVDADRQLADVSDFFDHLHIETEAYTRELNSMDELLRGGEDRLNKATLEEVLEKCVCLHQVNQSMVRTLEDHLQQYGYQPVEKPNLNFDLRKLVPERPLSSSKKRRSARKPLACLDNVEACPGAHDDSLMKFSLGDDLQSEADAAGASFMQYPDACDFDASQSYFVETNQLLQHPNVASTPMTRHASQPLANQSTAKAAQGTPEQVRRPVENAKTPSLDDWKLSAATRNMLHQNGKHSTKHARNNRNVAAAAVPAFQDSDDDDNDDELGFMPESPLAATDLSWVAQPAAPNQRSGALLASPPDKYASPPQAWPDRRPMNAGLDATPPTPTISSSPFVTFKLKDRLYDDDDEDEAGQEHQHRTSAEDTPPNHTCNASPAKTPLGRRVMDHFDSPDATLQPQSDDESSPFFLSSPPKLAKLLNPRRESLDGDSWIPLVEADEYEKWQTYIKRQVPLEVCNDVLIGINEFLALEERKVQSFTEEEIAPVVQSRLANIKLKTMLNALVSGHRMAIGQEGGITVYMVKRFYAC